MKIIVISHPYWIEKENEAMRILFENGLEYFHLRKPDATKYAYRVFLEKINPDFHKHIIIHNHFELINEYKIKGVHLNSKAEEYSFMFSKHKSRSCHSFKEIIEYKAFFDYLFLSPVFDSISKHNYKAGFLTQDLERASKKNIIDNKVIALGGVDPTIVNQIIKWNFGGIAVLGFLWEEYVLTKNIDKLLYNFTLLQKAIKNK